jgi:hypothetical protein
VELYIYHLVINKKHNHFQILMLNLSYNELLLLQNDHLHVYHVHHFVHDEDEQVLYKYDDDHRLILHDVVKD